MRISVMSKDKTYILEKLGLISMNQLYISSLFFSANWEHCTVFKHLKAAFFCSPLEPLGSDDLSCKMWDLKGITKEAGVNT